MSQYVRRTGKRARRQYVTPLQKLVIVSVMIVFAIMLGSVSLQVNKFAEEMENRDSQQSLVEPSTHPSEKIATPIPTQEVEEFGYFDFEPYVSQDAEDKEVDFWPVFTYSKDWGSDDSYRLAKLAYCEARNQSVETQAMVIMTVLNRLNSPYYPDTIEEVIFQQVGGVYQYSVVAPGGTWWYLEPTEESYEAVRMVQEAAFDNSQGCMFFESFYSTEDWQNSWHYKNLEFLFKMDDTRFYR